MFRDDARAIASGRRSSARAIFAASASRTGTPRPFHDGVRVDAAHAERAAPRERVVRANHARHRRSRLPRRDEAAAAGGRGDHVRADTSQVSDGRADAPLECARGDEEGVRPRGALGMSRRALRRGEAKRSGRERRDQRRHLDGIAERRRGAVRGDGDDRVERIDAIAATIVRERADRVAHERLLGRAIRRGERRGSTILVRRRRRERDRDGVGGTRRGGPRRKVAPSCPSLSSNVSTKNATHPSPRPYPSALASNVLHLPSGDSAPSAAMDVVVSARSDTLTPAATAASCAPRGDERFARHVRRDEGR